MMNIGLGRFGDRRLEKGGSFCMSGWSRAVAKAYACVDWEKIALVR